MLTPFLMGRARPNFTCLQRLQNKAARLVVAGGLDVPSIDLLREFHWLPLRQRIAFKLMLYVYKAMNNLAPSYLSAITQLQNIGSAEHRPRLCSSTDRTRLVVQRSYKKAVDMTFTSTTARLWNELPFSFREAPSLSVFKRKLKTHLFPRFTVLLFLFFKLLSTPFFVGPYISACVLLLLL